MGRRGKQLRQRQPQANVSVSKASRAEEPTGGHYASGYRLTWWMLRHNPYQEKWSVWSPARGYEGRIQWLGANTHTCSSTSLKLIFLVFKYTLFLGYLNDASFFSFFFLIVFTTCQTKSALVCFRWKGWIMFTMQLNCFAKYALGENLWFCVFGTVFSSQGSTRHWRLLFKESQCCRSVCQMLLIESS